MIEDAFAAARAVIQGGTAARAFPAAVVNVGDRIRVGSSTIVKYSLQDALEENFQKRMYDSAVRDPLTDELLFGRLEHGGTVTIGVREGALTFEVEPSADGTAPQPLPTTGEALGSS